MPLMKHYKCTKCGEVCLSLVDGPPARDENAIFQNNSINYCRFVKIAIDGDEIVMRVKSDYVTTKYYFAHLAESAFPRLCKHEWIAI